MMTREMMTLLFIGSVRVGALGRPGLPTPSITEHLDWQTRETDGTGIVVVPSDGAPSAPSQPFRHAGWRAREHARMGARGRPADH